jgi:fatty acid desaturase
MTSSVVLARLRRFLLALSALLFGGTVVELWLVNHTEDFVQWIPFVLCGIGLLVVVAVLFRPERETVMGLRAWMLIVIVGSLFGVYQHVTNNIAFEREISPTAPSQRILRAALGGANPLLAPGMLAVTALLALAATYKHGEIDE